MSKPTLAENQLMNVWIERGKAGLRLRYLVAPRVEEFFSGIAAGRSTTAAELGWRAGKFLGDGTLSFYNMSTADLGRICGRNWGMYHNTGRLMGHPDFGDNYITLSFLRSVGASTQPLLISLPGMISVDNLSTALRSSLSDFSSSFLTERFVDIRVMED